MEAPNAEFPLPDARAEAVGMSSDKLKLVCQRMQAMVDDEQIPGAIALVARHGKIVLREAVGWQNVAAGQPLEIDSILRFYSMTKPITSVGIMMLIEQGRIGLDDPIGQHIPQLADLPYVAGGTAEDPQLAQSSRDMTVRDLLRHTAGLTYGFYGDTAVDRMYMSKRVTNRREPSAAMIDKLASIPLLHPPGTKWVYSVATDVLGRLLEVASGQSLDEFLRQHILGPLKMRDTAFHVPAEKLDRFATNYGPHPKTNGLRAIEPVHISPFRHAPASFAGGSGLVSTVNDYARFCQMLLNGGELAGQRLLSPSAVDAMTCNQLPQELCPIQFLGMNQGFGFGLGFSVVYEKVRRAPYIPVGEYGWGGAASTHFWISPQHDLCAIVLTQRMPFSRQLEAALKPLVYDAVR